MYGTDLTQSAAWMNKINRETVARYRVRTPDSKSGLMTSFLVSSEEPGTVTRQQTDTDVWRQGSFLAFLGRSDDSLNDSDCMSSNDGIERLRKWTGSCSTSPYPVWDQQILLSPPHARISVLDSLWKHGGRPHRYTAEPAYRYTVEPGLVTEWNGCQQILLRLALTEEHLSRSIYMRIIVLINAALLECPTLSCGKQALVAMPCNCAEGMGITATEFSSEVCKMSTHAGARSWSFSRRKIRASVHNTIERVFDWRSAMTL
jgi:hypothetical protein